MLRRSWRVWRDSWGLFLTGAAIVQTPVALAAAAAAWATHIDIHSTRSWQYATVAAVVALWATLGHHGVQAIAERIEAAQVAGHKPRRSRLLRELPWLRLAIADVLVLVAVVAGITALVVPGVVLAVLLDPVFPLLTIEDQPVLATLKRSCRIVRPEFVPTLVLTGGAWAVIQLAGIVVATLGETFHRE